MRSCGFGIRCALRPFRAMSESGTASLGSQLGPLAAQGVDAGHQELVLATLQDGTYMTCSPTQFIIHAPSDLQALSSADCLAPDRVAYAVRETDARESYCVQSTR